MPANSLDMPSKLATQEAFSKRLWQRDPRRTYLAPPNLRLQNYLAILSAVSICTLLVYWYFLPFFITESMLMERLSQRDIGGLEKKATTTYQLANEVRKIVKENEEFYALTGQLRDSSAGSKSRMSKMEEALSHFKSQKEALEQEVAQLKAKMEKMKEEQLASMPAIQKKMKTLEQVNSATSSAFYATAKLVEGTAPTEDEWRYELARLQPVLENMKQASIGHDGDEKEVFHKLARTFTKIVSIQRATQLQGIYINRLNGQIMGTKLSQELAAYQKQFVKDMLPIFSAELVSAAANPEGAANLAFAIGDPEKDSTSLVSNFDKMTKDLAAIGPEAEKGFFGSLVDEGSQSAIKDGSAAEYVGKRLARYDEIQKLYTNPISSFIAQDKIDEAHKLFMDSLRSALEDQQPYIMWGMLKYGDRLLRDAMIQSPAEQNQKLWATEFEVERPFIFKRRTAQFELYDYKRHVCSVYPDVARYPSVVNAFSCESKNVENKSYNRKATFELEPGRYFIHQPESSDDELLVSFKGQYALESVSVYLRGAPFAFYIDVPFEEDGGYWVTPVRGVIHTYDKEAGAPSQLPMKPNPIQAESWARYDILGGAAGDWSKSYVMAARKFLSSLGEE